MSDPIEFNLTPSQFKKLEPIVTEANRIEMDGGVKFCVVAQVYLEGYPGGYSGAIVRAHLVGPRGFRVMCDALARVKVSRPPRKVARGTPSQTVC